MLLEGVGPKTRLFTWKHSRTDLERIQTDPKLASFLSPKEEDHLNMKRCKTVNYYDSYRQVTLQLNWQFKLENVLHVHQLVNGV